MAAGAPPADDGRTEDRRSGDLAQIIEGLGAPQKWLSPKFFYDGRGSALFDRITRLPEYYLTRAELSIMHAHVREIAELVGPQASLIEFGSGSSTKTRILLKELDRLAAYVPVDISREHLYAAAEKIAAEFPHIEVLPVAADFTRPFRLPQPKVMPLRNVVYFPGSTIGNFTPEAALDLLRVMHHEAGEDGALLIGVDLKKDRVVLERAYNDAAGVTAAFNLNVLERLNREFGATFDLRAFAHRAVYVEEHGRIEMHLVSLREQSVEVGGETFRLREGETIRTECSYKYTPEEFRAMAERAGFAVHTAWTDDRRYFSVQYCRRV
ncbi:MAG TPA: L-histidine N(alpha)-methyltransferase [Woeseiaceae bacterium]|nr:L-histidine N(alpha)-methyltransferase [Woeseiaceae bacterium]